MKKVLLFILCSLLIITSIGCSNNAGTENPNNQMGIDNSQNPFQESDENTIIMGGISHGPSAPNVDENEKLLPLIYSGEEIRYDYYVNASGQAKNVGFLMFVNGQPQPYKINNANSAYEFVHIFDLTEDNTDLPFTFIFTPVTGKQGDTLNVIISSIYNPSFKPDMNETSSYGGYHALLPASYSLFLETDVPDNAPQYDKIHGEVNLSNELVTNQLLETLSNSGMRDIDMNTFNNEIFSLVYYDGEMKTDNLQVSEEGILQVKYMICGHAGLEYETTFYLNHQPMASSNGISHASIIEKGSVSVITFDIELDKLEDYSTFYAVSVPKNAATFPDGIFEATKTQSILLFR